VGAADRLRTELAAGAILPVFPIGKEIFVPLSRYLINPLSEASYYYGFPTADIKQFSIKPFTYPIRLLRVDVSWKGAISGDKPFRVAGAPFGHFAMNVAVSASAPSDPEGVGGDSDHGGRWVNRVLDPDPNIDPEGPEKLSYWRTYWAAHSASPTEVRDMPWHWLPTVGDSHRSFDFQAAGGFLAADQHLILSWYAERPAIDDYQLAVWVEQEY
jgi:hypothetical protein